MTGRQFYDWQTAGGADDVMRMVDALERAELHWCAIGGIAVNHWASEPMVTRDVDFVVAVEEIDRAVAVLEAVGFQADRYEWSVNFRGRSQVSLQLSTEDFYRDFTARSAPRMSTEISCGWHRSKTRLPARSRPGERRSGGRAR